MQIVGINTLTLLDFPNHTAAIIFTGGCNFRCGFCHNPDYVLPEKLKLSQKDLVSEEAFFNFLETRKGLIDGVVISGGEPTLQPDLIDVVRKIKTKGFLVKLDTNGTNPEVLEKLIKADLLDFIAMDIKTTPEKYQEIVTVPVEIEKIIKSRDLIMQSGLDYEFRMTIFKEHHSREIFENVKEFIKGANVFALQNFQKESVLDLKYKDYSSFSGEELQEVKEIFVPAVKKVLVR